MSLQDIACLAFRIFGMHIVIEHLHLILGSFGMVKDLFRSPANVPEFATGTELRFGSVGTAPVAWTGRRYVVLVRSSSFSLS